MFVRERLFVCMFVRERLFVCKFVRERLFVCMFVREFLATILHQSSPNLTTMFCTSGVVHIHIFG